jgi:hypothetical protein
MIKFEGAVHASLKHRSDLYNVTVLSRKPKEHKIRTYKSSTAFGFEIYDWQPQATRKRADLRADGKMT